MASEVVTLIFKAESGEIKKAHAELSRIEKQGQKTEKATDGMTSGLKRMAIAAVSVGTAVAGFLKLISSARSMDVMSAQLKTATGSAEGEAQAFAALENLQRQLHLRLMRSQTLSLK